mgnify:CR=1 FL=1
MPETQHVPEAQDELYSHHVFIFPFKWLSKDNRKGTFLEQTSLNLIDDFFSLKSGWKREPYSINKPVKFNEYNYFYDYVREVLYDTHDGKNGAPLHDPDSGAENLLRHYRYNLKDGKHFYKISVPKRCQPYSLEVDSILLQFYNTGVGVLSFHLLNRSDQQKSPDDILAINQFGRRLYPPFFQLPLDLVGNQELFDYDANWTLPNYSELAGCISLEVNGKEPFSENWDTYKKPNKFQNNPFLLPQFIEKLLPSKFIKEFNLDPALDDRMFVVCWYGNDDLANVLYHGASTKKGKLGQRLVKPVSEAYLIHPWWYKFVFVDAQDLTCQNEVMQVELVRQATNARWANYHTFYGITDYSFVLLTSSLPVLVKNYASFLVTHLQTIYYKLAELVLLQRASVQRFSEEVTHISRLDATDDHSSVSMRVGSLYRQYIRFVNKVYFREATAQVQGIELYQMLQQQCRIEKQVKDLDGEIHELHNYVLQMLEEERVRQEEKRIKQEEKRIKQEKKILELDRQREEQQRRLNSLLAFFAPPSLILAFWGISIMPDVKPGWLMTLIFFLLPFLLGFSSYFAHQAFKAQTLKNRGFWITGVIALFAPLVISIYYQHTDAKEDKTKQERLEKTLLQKDTDTFQQPPLPLPVVVDTTKNHK